MSGKLQEIGQELKTVFSGRGSTLDTILPPLLFAILQALAGLPIAVSGAVILAFAFTLWRILHHQPKGYAFSGLLLVAVSAGLAWFSRNANNFFLPDLITSGLLLLAAVISNLAGKPLAAWSSHLTRAWPRAWYWLPQIRPAYSEVTWFWALFIGLRLALQVVLYRNAGTLTLTWVNTLLGWPVTILVLVVSYLYGIWRLRRLGGPSVQEYENHQPPPWQGQQRGF